jgi:hypothetical protein
VERRKSKFRAFQRVDGVIVERPRYLQPDSKAFVFEPKPVFFELSMKKRLPARLVKRRVEQGRDGYNGPMMQRFLDEDGPWTSYSDRRNGFEKN